MRYEAGLHSLSDVKVGSVETFSSTADRSNDDCSRDLDAKAPVDAELQAFWTVVTKPPFDAEKARRSEKRKRAKGAVGTAGLDGNLEDLDPLPLDDQNMQEMDMPQFEVGRSWLVLGLSLTTDGISIR